MHQLRPIAVSSAKVAIIHCWHIDYPEESLTLLGLAEDSNQRYEGSNYIFGGLYHLN